MKLWFKLANKNGFSVVVDIFQIPKAKAVNLLFALLISLIEISNKYMLVLKEFEGFLFITMLFIALVFIICG